MAGAPVGNTNSSKNNRLWANTIQRAIAQGDPDRLRHIADKLLSKAAEGDMQAIKELGDRLDGKPAQTIQGPGDDGEHKVINESRPVMSREEWLRTHGVGPTAGPTE